MQKHQTSQGGLDAISGGTEEDTKAMVCANNTNIRKARRKVLKAKYWSLVEKQRTAAALSSVFLKQNRLTNLGAISS